MANMNRFLSPSSPSNVNNVNLINPQKTNSSLRSFFLFKPIIVSKDLSFAHLLLFLSFSENKQIIIEKKGLLFLIQSREMKRTAKITIIIMIFQFVFLPF